MHTHNTHQKISRVRRSIVAATLKQTGYTMLACKEREKSETMWKAVVGAPVPGRGQQWLFGH